ncbi:polysaccharide pyruvyl transferase family protein [Opitutaceae bacterium TAV4]|nr:polysaccharide pyruvyl transferase family protein [Opitutaceae bacterium TAV4]RRK02851.1 polysaccharide pyruvyl transferase family protein [Opitutaceae bacterium TAV3]
MNRRSFLRVTFASSLAGALTLPTFAKSLTAIGEKKGRPPRILLRNAWQSMNIGDIAHYLGLLELLEKFKIDAEVRLWPSNLGDGADALLARRFPNVIVVSNKKDIATAFQECDFFLHGSSAGFGASEHAARWHRETGKPFGVIGVTLVGRVDQKKIDTASKADFIFFRESISLKKARNRGCTAPIMEWGPDTAFGVVTLRNDTAATAFMREHGLEEGKFMCCIPRWRITPHWLIGNHKVNEAKRKRNEEMKEHDHAQLREAIIAIARETDLKVLVCHEDQTQIQLGKEILVDPLPDDVKKKVVWRDRFWLTDEALSIYVRSVGLFGNEMHSPIMCIASGIPAVVCRFAEQTQKGYMWHDIGLNDWLFDLDKPDEVAQIVPTVLAIAKDPATAKAKAAKAREIVLEKQREEMAALTKSLARV